MNGGRILSARDWLVLLVVGLAMFIAGFATLPPTDRDESRYIVTSERMADTGDIVDLRYQDQPRYLQPAGIYWLQSAATALLDSPDHDSVWTYRLPSLLGALIAMLLTGWIGARFFGRGAGIAAALLLGACFSLNFEARIAKIDAALLAAIVVAQLALMRAYIEPTTSRWTSATFWAALGVGMMLKGPVALIFAGATAIALVTWDRNAAWLKNLRPVWGPLVTLAIAAPWFIAIGVMTDGAFYTRALMRNFLGKVGAGEQGHSGPPGYHLALFLIAFWPGSLLALRAAGFAWRERGERAVRFLICWIIPGWIVFEFVATKLPHYVLPTYPALALLAAAALFAPKPAQTNRLGTIAFVVCAILWVGASALIAAAAPGLLWWAERDVDATPIIIGALAFAAAMSALWLLWRNRKLESVGALALAGLLAWGNLFGYTLPRLDSLWMSPRINEAARALRTCDDSVLVTTPYSEPSLVFLYGREITAITPSGEAAARALAAAGPCGLALIGAEERTDFLEHAATLGLALNPVEHIAGQNYSNGDTLDLTLFIQTPQPRAAEPQTAPQAPSTQPSEPSRDAPR